MKFIVHIDWTILLIFFCGFPVFYLQVQNPLNSPHYIYDYEGLLCSAWFVSQTW